MTVFVLDRHSPACKLHHLSPIFFVEVKQGSLSQRSLEIQTKNSSSAFTIKMVLKSVYKICILEYFINIWESAGIYH